MSDPRAKKEFKSSSALLFDTLGSKSGPVEEKKQSVKKPSAEIFPDQGYIAVYCYSGTIKRLGVGHSALFDGNTFYSYGPGALDQTIGTKASSEAIADRFADEESSKFGYGSWKKIIIPVRKDFFENRKKLQDDIEIHWQPSFYKLMETDCVHMVQDYLVRSGLQKEKLNANILLPSDIEANARKVGLAQTLKMIEEDQKRVLSASEVTVRRAFLTLLSQELKSDNHIPSEMKKIKIHDQALTTDDSKVINEAFCQVRQKLAERYYKKPTLRSEKSEMWYADWFKLVTNPSFDAFAEFAKNLQSMNSKTITEPVLPYTRPRRS